MPFCNDLAFQVTLRYSLGSKNEFFWATYAAPPSGGRMATSFWGSKQKWGLVQDGPPKPVITRVIAPLQKMWGKNNDRRAHLVGMDWATVVGSGFASKPGKKQYEK